MILNIGQFFYVCKWYFNGAPRTLKKIFRYFAKKEQHFQLKIPPAPLLPQQDTILS